MSLPILQPHLIVGLEPTIRGNIHYLSDDDIVYPVGCVVAVHNINTKKQRYIKLSEKGKNLTHLLVSPNKKLIAIAETTDKLPVITLWDPALFRKKKTINLPQDKDIVCSRYACMEFTYDSKFMVCVTAEPDWTLYVFKCDKGKLESFARANNLNGTGTVVQVACNPNDVNQIAVCGDQVLRCLGCVDFTWRQFGYNKLDPCHYTSCCWLSQDRLIVGSYRGKIMILETGEIRGVFHASDLPLINMKLKEEEEADLPVNPSLYDVFGVGDDETECWEIRCIVNISRGFLMGYLNGKVHFYEKENSNKYRKRGIFRIPDRTVRREYEEEPEVITTVNTIAINPSQDRILVTCREMQLWSERLFVHDKFTGPEVDLVDFGYSVHLGNIGGLSVCRWKPIVLSIGCQDRSVKIWNYETYDVELVQIFEDDIYSVSLHPTGLYTVIGFSDKLRFMTIMIDEIVLTKEFSIRNCEMTRFSHMGHLFAAANGTVIQIYSAVTFELMYMLKGHNGKITGLAWSNDDTILASCGFEGAVYLWDVVKSTRIHETVIKSVQSRGIQLSRDGKNAFVVGHDGHVREYFSSNVQRDVVIPPGAPLDAIVLSALDNMMFVTGNNGVVYVVKMPLLEKADVVEYNMHNKTISKMVLSCDDKYLITASTEGILTFWKLLNTEDKAIKLDLISSSEILISKQILEDKMMQIRNLQIRMKELETEHSYQIRQTDALAASRLKDVHKEYCNAIEELKLKNEQMEAEHIQEINNINAQISQMKSNHELVLQKLEATYNEKLIAEYEKFVSYENKMNRMLADVNMRYTELQKAKDESEAAITEDYEIKLQEAKLLYDELMETNKTERQDHEIIKQQIEDDADREIYELKESHTKELKEEQDINVRLRSEISVVKKKYLLSQKEVEDLKHKVFTMENEHIKFKNFIYELEKEIIDSKKEIQERDQTIEEKEKRIFTLKSKNQELEKFKFILDFKIKELKSQIEPKERIITEQNVQINEMVRELENLQKVILGLDLQLGELKEKLAASSNEVRKEIDKNRRMKKSLQDIRVDIHHASGYIQNVPMLQKSVKDMYHKYNADKDFEATQKEDTEAKNEFLRQRDFLERTVATLHEQATKNTSLLSYDKVRLVDENAALLEETNQLRKNLVSEVTLNRKLNSLIGMSRVTPQQAQQKVNFATATNKDIHKQYTEQLEQNAYSLDAMQQENLRLVNKIIEKSQGKSHPKEK
ncbi:cilia- and flagella-associated protein 57 [Diabrotica virgifera virgifera]|uniref:Cilia- and flagella-associated protein 57 n=3 Tax=Diabrotica virgifera virgifera TaxID=50390 RepID=A0ABM5JV82_DIAVI|nr:cilia- and flagella-associated protein 57 [Diabrotica virgifera virgifera]